MLNKIISLLKLNKIVNPQTLKKGIEKLNPRLSKFFTNAENAGYGIGAAITYLQSQVTGQDVVPEEGEATFETSGREISRQKSIPKNVAKSALNIGLGALAGGGAGAAIGGIGDAVLNSSKDSPQTVEDDEPETIEIPGNQSAQKNGDIPNTNAQQELAQIDKKQPGVLETLTRIDPILSEKIQEFFSENAEIQTIDSSLKSTKKYLQRVLHAERKFRMPFSRILESIFNETHQMDPVKNNAKNEYRKTLNQFTQDMGQ